MPVENRGVEPPKNEIFESHLREILDFGPEQQNNRRQIETPNTEQARKHAPHTSKKVSPLIEVIIRIAAACAVLLLLARFALNVVSD